jgi:hypothetical protein
MANQIQIKRSNTTPTPGTTLTTGEQAFSYNSNSLFIGAQSGVGSAALKIGGTKYGYLDNVTTPGVLYANATIVTDANGFVSNVFTQGLAITTSTGSITSPVITSISNFGNSSQIGVNSMGLGSEIATTSAIYNYVHGVAIAASTPAGSNGQFQYNNSGTLAGTSNFVYNNVLGTITTGNSSVYVQLGYLSDILSTQHNHANVNNFIQAIITNDNTGFAASADWVAYNDAGINSNNFIDMGINSSGWSNTQWTINGANDGYLYTGGGNLSIGTNSIGSYVNFFANGALANNEVMRITAGANVGIGNTNPNAKLQVTGTANISGDVAIGGITRFAANLVLGSSGISANGNYGTTGQALLSNGSATYWGASLSTAGSNTQIQFNDSGSLGASAGFTFDKTSNTITVGNSTVNSSINSTTFSGTSNNSTYLGGSSIGNIQGWISSNSSAAYSNAVSTLTTNNTVFTGNNSFGGTNTNFTSNVTMSGTVTIGNNVLVSGHIIPSANVTYDLGNTTNAFRALYIKGTTIYLGSLSLQDNSGSLAVTTTIGGAPAGATFANLTSTTNTVTIGSASYFVANGNFGLGNSAPADKLSVNGTTNLGGSVVITGANIVATSANLSVKDISISGNLTVSGTLTTIDTNNLQVKDSMIKLADQNTVSDILDFGFYGVANTGGTTYYSGLFRDHGSSTATNPTFRLFTSTTEPTTTVSSPSYGTLISYLQSGEGSGGLIANSTVVNITANATLSVALTANSLTLTSALAAIYGGTGQSSYSVGDLLYASGSTALSKLSVPGSVANGQVLQIVNNLPAYGTLDGGSF